MPLASSKYLWTNIAERSDWREYILPKRTPEEFEREGWEQAQQFQRYAPKGAVMEYGVGVGRVLKHVRADRRIGVDVSPGFLRIAQLYDIEPVLTDGIEIPFLSNMVDFVYSLMVFQHCDKEAHVDQLKEICRVVRYDGVALIQFPRNDHSYYSLASPDNRYSHQEVFNLGMAAGFKRVTVHAGRLVNYGDASPIETPPEWFMKGYL